MFVGEVTWDQVREIAEKKMEDLNARDLDGAAQIIAGTARSMGLKVVEELSDTVYEVPEEAEKPAEAEAEAVTAEEE
jgi:hypothetical protein